MNEIVKTGQFGGIAETQGESLTFERDTRLKLTEKKGSYLIGKYMGISRIEPKGIEPFDVARFAVVETNVEGDSGVIVAGEVCSMGVPGLLRWALQKTTAGRFLYIRYNGMGKGKGKDGAIRDMNRFTVRDVTEPLKKQGVE